MPNENIEDTTSLNNEEEEEILFDIPEEGDEEEEVQTPDEIKDEPDEAALLAERVEKAERALRTTQRKYDKLVERNKEIESKIKEGRPLSEEEKKEQQAQDFIAKAAREEIKRMEREAKEAEQARLDQMSAELDEVLDENVELRESQVLDVIEKFADSKIQITPRQAAEIIKNGLFKAEEEKVEKPKMPQAKRGGDKVTPSEIDTEKYKKMSFDEKLEYGKRQAMKKLGLIK